MPPPYLAARFRWLPPTLYNKNHDAARNCSKIPRGLRLPAGDSGLCARGVGSLGPSWGQQDSRSAIHASRQLSGKVLRYLKRVIVTPAVYRCLAPLNGGLTYRHWAGVTNCTKPYGLAVCYVFIKQTESLGHCDALSLAGQCALLIPKLRSQFAEFPQLGYPNTP